MYRYILMTLIGLVGLTPAAMAQEVTATGNYKGQDYALSRRVEVLRAALDATVQQVQKISVCNAKGMVYVSGTAAGVDADGCKTVGGAIDCIRVIHYVSSDSKYGTNDSYRYNHSSRQNELIGYCDHAEKKNVCINDMSKAYFQDQVPAGYINIGTIEDHTYEFNSRMTTGYYINAYCKAPWKNRIE